MGSQPISHNLPPDEDFFIRKLAVEFIASQILLGGLELINKLHVLRHVVFLLFLLDVEADEWVECHLFKDLRSHLAHLIEITFAEEYFNILSCT